MWFNLYVLQRKVQIFIISSVSGASKKYMYRLNHILKGCMVLLHEGAGKTVYQHTKKHSVGSSSLQRLGQRM